MTLLNSAFEEGEIKILVKNIPGGNPEVPGSKGIVELTKGNYNRKHKTIDNIASFERVPPGQNFRIDVGVESTSNAFPNVIEHWGFLENVSIEPGTSEIVFHRNMPFITNIEVIGEDDKTLVSNLIKGDSLNVILYIKNPSPYDISLEVLLNLRSDEMDSIIPLKKNCAIRKGEKAEVVFSFCPEVSGNYYFAPAVRIADKPDLYTDCWDFSRTPLFSVKDHQRIIDFAGWQWDVKSGFSSPGPNYWSDDDDLVWVDKDSRLNLTLTPYENHWKATEVISRNFFGYGTYTFFIDADIENYAADVVAAIFLYSNEENEIDVEFSRWGNDMNQRPGNYVIQPYYKPGNQFDFPLSLGGTYTTHRIVYKPGKITFESWHGHHHTPPEGMRIASWEYTGANIPAEEKIRLHFNIWLFQGSKPEEKKQFSFSISDFVYKP